MGGRGDWSGLGIGGVLDHSCHGLSGLVGYRKRAKARSELVVVAGSLPSTFEGAVVR